MSIETGGPSPEDTGAEINAGRPTEEDFADRLGSYSALLSRPQMRPHYEEMKRNLEELARGGGEPELSPGWTTEDFQELLRRVNELGKGKK